MTIDKYALCPGGTGKKIKFCCADLKHEIEKVHRMREADQRQGCLEYLELLEKKYPDRLCLCTLKAELYRDLGRADDAQQALANILERDSNNPTALAESALVVIEKEETPEGVRKAIDLLQSALQSAADQWPDVFLDAFLAIGMAAFRGGLPQAALGHLLVYTGTGIDDQPVNELLTQFYASPEVPLILKEERRFQPAPDDVPWKADFEQCSRLAARVQWRAAAEQLEKLSAEADHAAIWTNLAILRGWLGDQESAAAAWRRCLAHDIPRADKVVIEMLLGMQAGKTALNYANQMSVTFPVLSWDPTLERLLSSSRVGSSSVQQQARYLRKDTPAPRNAFVLLSREGAIPDDPRSMDDIPITIGRLFLYGRETDREPRLELLYFDDESEAVGLVSEIVGDSLGQPGEPIQLAPQSALAKFLRWDIQARSLEEHQQFSAMLPRAIQQRLVDHWMQLPNDWLGGKSPAEAAAEPQLRLLLEAGVEQLETGFTSLDTPVGEEVTRPLREKLGLETDLVLDEEQLAGEDVRLFQLRWLVPEKLSDDNLVLSYVRAKQHGIGRAVLRFALEIINRESLESQLPFAYVHAQIADELSGTPAALEHYRKARELLIAQGQSPAPMVASELLTLFQLGRSSEFLDLVNVLQRKFGRDRGVMEALGSVIEYVQQMTRTGEARSAAPAAGAQTAPSPAAGGLWTPEGESSPAAEQPSKLWLPD